MVEQDQYHVRAYRVGFTTQGDVMKNGEVVMSVANMFTVRGAEKEAMYLAEKLRSGSTVEQLVADNIAAKAGW